MILKRYLNFKLLAYFLLVNCSLTLLYNLIGFIEKLVRETNSNIGAITIFMLLNLLPTFFELIPLSTWVATCIFIWEFNQTKGWDTFNLLGIKPTIIIRIMLISGTILSATSFIGKEIAIHPIIKLARKYKMKKVRNEPNNKIFDQWISPKENVFLYFEFLDLKSNKGSGLIIINMSKDFVAKKRTEAKNFYLEPKKQTITLLDGTITNLKKNTSTLIQSQTMEIPQLFLHLKMFNVTPSLRQQIQNIILASNLSLHYPLNQELGRLLARLLSHLQPLIYILLTLCLFFLAQGYIWFKWLLIAAPYPFILISTAIGEFMLQHNTMALVIAIPYLVSFAAIYLCVHRLRMNPT